MSLVLEVVVVLRGVEEIPDEEHEQVTGRVCAIDVAKESGKGVHAGAARDPAGRARVQGVGCGRHHPLGDRAG
jgi:hypothetical protein